MKTLFLGLLCLVALNAAEFVPVPSRTARLKPLIGPSHSIGVTNEVTILINAPRQFTVEESVQWLKQAADIMANSRFE